MTVHSAKGLEFDAVFITGIEEGLFPHENSLSDADGVEEERRLMYVAITRARQRLYLSFSQTRLLHGQTRYNVKSRFFDELPEGALKWLSPRQRRASARAMRASTRAPGRAAADWARSSAPGASSRRAPTFGAGPSHVAHRQRLGPAHRAVGVPHQVRRRRGADARRPRRRRARADQLRPPRRQVAGVGHRQADADRLRWLFRVTSKTAAVPSSIATRRPRRGPC